MTNQWNIQIGLILISDTNIPILQNTSVIMLIHTNTVHKLTKCPCTFCYLLLNSSVISYYNYGQIILCSFPIQMVQKWGMSEKYVGAAQLIVRIGELSKFAVRVRIGALEPCSTY